jgi:hypothetical protein
MLCIEKDIIFYIKIKINLIIFYIKMNINNVINKSDVNMKKMFNMFSFVDTPSNAYSSLNSYQENLPFLFSSFSPLIKSEDSMACITSEDRYDYDDKLQQLQSIISRCNTATNKQECLYNNFNDDTVVNLINNLTNIIKKLNKECMYNKIRAEQEEIMCSSSGNLLNSYNVSDLNKVSVFFAKYSTIIKNLKNLADTNIYDYLNKCGSDTRKLESYNRAQNVLANTLFQLGNINNTIQTIIQQNTNVDNSRNTNVDNSSVTAIQTNFNTCLSNPEISGRITDLNNQIRTLTTNNAILNDKLYKLTDDKSKYRTDEKEYKEYKEYKDNLRLILIIVFVSLFVITIIIAIYKIMKERRKTTIITSDPMSGYGPSGYAPMPM